MKPSRSFWCAGRATGAPPQSSRSAHNEAYFQSNSLARKTLILESDATGPTKPVWMMAILVLSGWWGLKQRFDAEFVRVPHSRGYCFQITYPTNMRKRPIMRSATESPLRFAKAGPSREPSRIEAFRFKLYQARCAGRSSGGMFSSI